MGKIVVAASVSVDGMFEGPDADLSWHMMGDGVHAHFNELLVPAGALFDGRVTHELMAGYWPTADEDPDAADEEKAFAAYWRTVPKYVLSTTLPDTGEWNVTVLRSFDPVAVRALADPLDGDMFVGGAVVADLFRRAGLVDEWYLFTHPVVVGAGRPLLPPGAAPTPLTLLDTRRFDNGVVLAHYATDRRGG